MIVVVAVIDPKGNLREIPDRDIAKSGIPDLAHVRIQGVAQVSLYKDEGSVDVVREVPLLRRKGRDETALDGEEMSGNLPGGTHHQVPLEHIFGENFILGQGMVGSTDTGYGGRRKRFETKSAFFLSFFEVKSRADLLVFHKPQKGGKWYHPDRRAKGNSRAS